MMLRHVRSTEAADLIIKRMERAITERTLTGALARLTDGATQVSCSQFAESIIDHM